MPELIRISDVAPRDGLQNEPRIVPTADKARLVRMLIAARVDEIEVSSFVSPKWVPQLADAAELFAATAAEKPAGCIFSALVPNEKGAAAAIAVNERAGRRLIDKLSVFTAASETFSQRNTNASIAETIDRFVPVVAMARSAGLATRGYISCIVKCPFEGFISPWQVANVAVALAGIGIDEIDLGETIGAGTPETIRAVLAAVATKTAGLRPTLTLHLHDTFGNAAACAAEALQFGIRSFDSAAGGLGGCPYASVGERRAPGNISTEVLLQTIETAGFSTHVDRVRLAEAARFAQTLRSGA